MTSSEFEEGGSADRSHSLVPIARVERIGHAMPTSPVRAHTADSPVPADCGGSGGAGGGLPGLAVADSNAEAGQWAARTLLDTSSPVP